MGGLNVWTVLWISPDGKPFTYNTPHAHIPRRPEPETRRFSVREVQQYREHALRHLPDATFRCLSNVEIPGVEVVPLEHPELIAWWAKMELFRPGLPEGRNIYFDLDTIQLRGIGEIVDFPARFAAIQPGELVGSDQKDPWPDQEGKWRYPRYQTSVMVWDTPAVNRFWTRFQQIKAETLHHCASDQDFLGREFRHEARLPTEWFAKVRSIKRLPSDQMKVVLSMRMHNDGAAKRYPWVREFWP